MLLCVFTVCLLDFFWVFSKIVYFRSCHIYNSHYDYDVLYINDLE